MKCIYCNDEADLSISDIIPAALTGAKVKRKFVCRGHNSFTNDNYEKKMIHKLDIFRNLIGLTERDGDPVRYKGELIIGDYTSKNKINLSDNASILNSNRLFSMIDKQGKKVLVGPKELLLKKNNINEDNVKDLTLENISFSSIADIRELFISESSLHVVAKIAYEWHCYINDVGEYCEDKYHNIVSYILNPKETNNLVEVVTDDYIVALSEQYSRTGTNMLFEYNDCDGYTYVIFNLWNVIAYKVKITSHNEKSINSAHFSIAYFYHVDGTENAVIFGVLGNYKVNAMNPNVGISLLAEDIKSRLSKLGERDLSIEYLQKYIKKISNKLVAYQENKITLLELFNFEHKDTILPTYVLEQLYIHKDEYLPSEDFYQNMKRILQTDNRFVITDEFVKNVLERYQNMDAEGTFSTMLVEAISYFECISDSKMDT